MNAFAAGNGLPIRLVGDLSVDLLVPEHLEGLAKGLNMKKVKAYLQQHLDHLVIHRLRTHQPLTEEPS